MKDESLLKHCLEPVPPKKKMPYFIAVPAAAGTGFEAAWCSVITIGTSAAFKSFFCCLQGQQRYI
ncbi:MAG: hypothetical protein ACOX4I_03675 [Anaerovoracaceae bacterium]|jgi:alcohol dehydrogenase class IV